MLYAKNSSSSSEWPYRLTISANVLFCARIVRSVDIEWTKPPSSEDTMRQLFRDSRFGIGYLVTSEYWLLSLRGNLHTSGLVYRVAGGKTTGTRWLSDVLCPFAVFGSCCIPVPRNATVAWTRLWKMARCSFPIQWVWNPWLDLEVAPKASSVEIGTYERIMKMISTGSLSNWSAIVDFQHARWSEAAVMLVCLPLKWTKGLPQNTYSQDACNKLHCRSSFCYGDEYAIFGQLFIRTETVRQRSFETNKVFCFLVRQRSLILLRCQCYKTHVLILLSAETLDSRWCIRLPCTAWAQQRGPAWNQWKFYRHICGTKKHSAYNSNCFICTTISLSTSAAQGRLGAILAFAPIGSALLRNVLSQSADDMAESRRDCVIREASSSFRGW